MSRKVLGVNFLEQHREMAKNVGLDNKHVIVDKRDYCVLLQCLMHNNIDFHKLLDEYQRQYDIKF